MNEQDKGLLLKDLCARLPYGVMMNVLRSNVIEVAININPFNEEIWLNDAGAYVDIDEIKPYLRPMSSMTKEEFSKVKKLFGFEITTSLGKTYIDDWKQGLNEINYTIDLIDWLNAHHFDYRGLIEKGLALEAPPEMYKNE